MVRTALLVPQRRALVVAALLAFGCSGVAFGATRDEPTGTAAPSSPSQASHPAAQHHKLDISGQKRIGKASYYAHRFSGRKMADGTPMQPQGDNAASKTLPLGTRARVKNLETGQTAEVTVRDRGPYVPGRIIDLSPKTARDIGITRKHGVAPVEVAPIEVPLADGSVRPGAGARELASR